MISDLEDGSLPAVIRADLCIIGAGPAGIVLADEMRNRGLSVCLAEGGGRGEDRRGRALFDGDSIGHDMLLREGRHRGFGGSARRWGGRMAELSAIDFEQRSWVPGSGWPFALDELRPYYERAKRVSNFTAGWQADADALASVGRTLPEISGEDIRPFIWRYASDRIGPKPAPRLALGKRRNFDWGDAHFGIFRAARDVRVLLHANLVHLTPSPGEDAIAEARFRSLNGHHVTVSAGIFIVCAGGLETPRILLQLDAMLAQGLPARATLGRFFMQHPRGTILTIETDRDEAARLTTLFGISPRRAHGALQYEVGLTLTEAAQRRHHLSNASAALYALPGETSAWEAAKRLRRAIGPARRSPIALRDIGYVATGAFTALPQLWRRYVSGAQPHFRGGTVQIVADLEQVPTADSRLFLSQARDRLGLRTLIVDWRLSDAEWRTARHFAEAIAAEVREKKMGTPCLAPWLAGTSAPHPLELAGNYHFIGAARMATTAADGVVDQDARVFGLRNLFVAGCAIFPTGGHANPTLSILALTIRLADHLKRLLEKP